MSHNRERSVTGAVPNERITRRGDAQGSALVAHTVSASMSGEAWETGAGEGIRTLDPNLGKVVLYP